MEYGDNCRKITCSGHSWLRDCDMVNLRVAPELFPIANIMEGDPFVLSGNGVRVLLDRVVDLAANLVLSRLEEHRQDTVRVFLKEAGHQFLGKVKITVAESCKHRVNRIIIIITSDA